MCEITRKKILKEMHEVSDEMDSTGEETLGPDDAQTIVFKGECGKILAVLRVRKGSEKEAAKLLKESASNNLASDT